MNVLSYTDFTGDAIKTPYGDAHNYIAMSQHTFAHVHNPFAFRLMSPLIVHELMKLPGVGLNTGWFILTFVATSLAIMVFFSLLHDRLKLSTFTSTVFSVMLACTYQYSLWNYQAIWMVDALNNLFYVVALYCLLARRLWAFMAVILLGSLNKETTLMLAPLYPLLALLRTGSWKARETVSSTLAAIGVGVVYFAYHMAVLAKLGGGAYQFGSGYDGHSVTFWIMAVLNSRKTIEQLTMFQVFQYLWFVFAYSLYRIYKAYGIRSEWFVISVYMLATAMLGRMFATDTERVYVMIAPAVLAVCAIVFNGFVTEQQRQWVCALVFLYLALNFEWLTGQNAVFANVIAIAIFIMALQPARLDFKRLLNRKPSDSHLGKESRRRDEVAPVVSLAGRSSG